MSRGTDMILVGNCLTRVISHPHINLPTNRYNYIIYIIYIINL